MRGFWIGRVEMEDTPFVVKSNDAAVVLLTWLEEIFIFFESGIDGDLDLELGLEPDSDSDPDSDPESDLLPDLRFVIILLGVWNDEVG